jgi:hypothetical protein
MPSCVDLPAEIWFKVAGFLDPKFLYSLRSLNSVFLRAALEARYRKVEIMLTHNIRTWGYIQHTR